MSHFLAKQSDSSQILSRWRNFSPFSDNTSPFAHRAVYKTCSLALGFMLLFTALAPTDALANSGGIKDVPAAGDYTGSLDGKKPTASNGNVTIDSNVEGIVYGGIAAMPGINAKNNSVVIDGGTTKKVVFGAYAYSGNASGNSVIINSGTAMNSVFGGGASGNSSGNSVTLNGGTVKDIFGGYAGGSVTGNTVTIHGGTAEDIIGGFSYNASSGAPSVSGNTVIIRGGRILGNVAGGVIQQGGGNSVNNTVSIWGNPIFSPTTSINGGDHIAGSGDTRTGNTLNIFTGGIHAGNIFRFQHYNFALPTNGKPALTLAGPAATDFGGVNSNINLPYAMPGNVLPVGKEVIVLTNTGNTLINLPNLAPGKASQGVALVYDYSLKTSADNKSLVATIEKRNLHPQAKTPAEGMAAAQSLAILGSDLIASEGISAALNAGERGVASGSAGKYGISAFAAFAGSSIRTNTASSYDRVTTNGMAFMAGLAKKWETASADITAGAFFEGAYGSYTSRHKTGTLGYKGDGSTNTLGGGVLARVDVTNSSAQGLYAEASFRAGSLYNSFTVSNVANLSSGNTGTSLRTPYFGAHAGIGYVLNIGQSAQVDLYGKYFWVHQQAKKLTVLGDTFNFKSADSHRIRVGARVSYAVLPEVMPYVGLAYEHEFGGKIRSTVYGLSVPAPSANGGTGVGEIGLRFASKDKQVSLDCGIQGFIGKRQGVSGSLQLKYTF